MDRTTALERIKVLIGKYAELEKEGRIGKYNEEMTKEDFILPLFDALGWNTADSREVSAEEAVSKQRVDSARTGLFFDDDAECHKSVTKEP